jgi:V/A-type H+-transporting ATPase subunit A
MAKQYEMLKTILHFHEQALASIEAGVETSEIFKLAVREKIARAKYIPRNDMAEIPKIHDTIDEQLKKLKVADSVSQTELRRPDTE